MIPITSLGSKFKSLSSWPFGYLISNSFVKYDENNNLVAFYF
jgi:hypothetical protein